ncbi:MAG: phage portal protein [Nitrospiraceae bacterium]
MNLFDRAMQAVGLMRVKHVRRTVTAAQRRTFAAAMANRLTSGWMANANSANAELRMSLKMMRMRSRELCQNNDYGKKFLSILCANVVGPNGIMLQNKARDKNGTLDTAANKIVEDGWKAWGSRGSCDVTRTLSWVDALNLFLKSVARDGEVLIRRVKGYDNPSKYAMQFLEADHLDENLNEDLRNGNKIKMGVEVNEWDAPVAYHVFTNHPGDMTYSAWSGQRYQRIPASEVLHLYIRERVGQTRGIPWMHSAMTRLNQIGGYEEAELIAARIGACKMGVITSPDGDGYTGQDEDEGTPIEEAEPGIFTQLPQGMKLESFMPEHPTGNFPHFMKAILRGVSSGLGVSYNTLASDLENVNYSSIRQGVLDERDQYRAIQGWVIEAFCRIIYEEWLSMALLAGTINLPVGKYEKFNAPVWQGRGWQWVDPQNDITANIAAIKNGLKSRTMIAAEQGVDLEDVFNDLAEEQKMAEQIGVELEPVVKDVPPNPAGQGGQPAEPPAKAGAKAEDAKAVPIHVNVPVTVVMPENGAKKVIRDPQSGLIIGTEPVKAA